MSWDIEAIITEVIETVRDAIPEFLSVDETGESIPPSGPFCLVEHVGGPVALGNLEDWSIGFRITAGVARNQMIGQERQAVRGFALRIIEALRANVVIADCAFLTNEADIGMSGEMRFAEHAFVGCSVTVRYQVTEGVVDSISD
jgi:hypothetical protein